jgi:hypothetical protein
LKAGFYSRDQKIRCTECLNETELVAAAASAFACAVQRLLFDGLADLAAAIGDDQLGRFGGHGGVAADDPDVPAGWLGL